ncbi:exosortase/archaeosortase family protein [Amycolatopsis cynarae]|uniref:Exosortase/archaeosortase family protein n=1 Tax=Amycolatopsis cynarae TaxID=2995223 RepID=A0ABY7B8K2_9PSEU|nr:exosortase/archaeosortase family protein [Amycolatopsis sp. HUAS 11-8]WAL68481.1 exosortase/archaeosortase family protein [Amycolatopsis sp. HUAS 11-8]
MTSDGAASLPGRLPGLSLKSGGSGAPRSWTAWLPAALCGAIAVAMVFFQGSYRLAETWLASELVRTVVGQHAWPLPGEPVLLFETSASPGAMAIRVSLACSSVLLVAPLFLISGALFLSSTRSRVRIPLATLVAFVIVVIANNIRLGLIMVLASRFGRTGLDWAHILAGSLVMLTAGGIAILLYLRIVAGSKAGRHRKEGER